MSNYFNFIFPRPLPIGGNYIFLFSIAPNNLPFSYQKLCFLAQNARKKEIKAAQRRAGGGGVLGVRPDSDSDDGLLNAAQIKIADALHQRIKKDLGQLEPIEKSTLEASSSSESEEGITEEHEEKKADDQEESEDGGGVALFKNAPLVTNVVIGGSNLNREFNGPCPRSKGAAEVSSDEEESMKRCRAAAVNSDVLLKNAEKAAKRARDLIMPVNPTSDDEGGKARKRRRKRLKQEEETRKKARKAEVALTLGTTAAAVEIG